MLVVIATTAVKAMAMTIAFLAISTPPLMTLGDAIASFLRHPDERTASPSLCTMGLHPVKTHRHYQNDSKFWSAHNLSKQLSKSGPAYPLGWWFPGQFRWHDNVSHRRFGFINSVCIIIVAIAVFWIIFAKVDGTASSLSSFGTGSTASLTRLGNNINRNTFKLIFLANFPQLLFSLAYLQLNSLFTGMLMGHESNSFGTTRQPLRVSFPHGQQRRTTYLSLPYRFSIPLITCSTLLHWLASEAVFLVHIDVFQTSVTDVSEPSNSILAILLSYLALLILVTVFSLLVIVANIAGAWALKPGIPVVSTCSLGIAAACHTLDPEPQDSSEMLLRWGVNNRILYSMERDYENENRHREWKAGGKEYEQGECSRRLAFSAFVVKEPDVDVVYA